MSIRKLFLKEDPKAKKAMTNIVRRGIAASPDSEKEWGDALLKAVDTFDVEVRSAGGKAGKAAPAKGDKQASKGKPQGDDGVPAYDPKKATRTGTSKPQEKPPEDPDDDWFMDDEPELGAGGPGSKAPKKAKAKAEPAQEPEPGEDDDFPEFPAPQSANFQVGGDDEEEYRSPFAHMGLGAGHSSWDDVPDWFRDQEKMPGPGKTSMNLPRDRSAEPTPTPRGKVQAVGTGGGLKGKAKPWSQKDIDNLTGAKKPGLLSRVFGRKK